MTPEILPMLGMTITILGAIWAMNQSLRGEIKDVRGEMQEGFKATDEKITGLRAEMHNEFKAADEKITGLRAEMHSEFKAVDEKFIDMRADMGKLSERMARVEGMIDGLREAIAARTAA